MKYLPLLLILLACTPDPEYSIDPDLAPYIESFFHESEIRGHNLRTSNLIVYKEHGLAASQNAKALYRKRKGQISIAFDQEYFEIVKKYPARVEALMFHEMGHAFLHRDHTTACVSLMDPTGCEVCYENDPVRRLVLIDELFNPCQ